MKTVFLNKMTGIFLFPLILIFLFSISFLYTNAQTSSHSKQKKGSINVCVSIIDESGKILNNFTAVNLSFFSFELPILKGKTYSNSELIERAYFNKPYFIPNTDIFSNNAIKNDAVCILFDGLELGSYFYQKEIISQKDNWPKTLYNDQYLIGNFNIKDFTVYNGEFLNLQNNIKGKFKSDGKIFLTKDEPNKTLVILNKYKFLSKELQCSENTTDNGSYCNISNTKNNKSNNFSEKNQKKENIKKELNYSYLSEYLGINRKNNPKEVKKLQIFLRDYEGFSNLKITGIFNKATFDAVLSFQVKYKNDILVPWGINLPTGFVYITTKNKINEIYSQSKIALTEKQIKEIDNFKKRKNRAIKKEKELENTINSSEKKEPKKDFNSNNILKNNKKETKKGEENNSRIVRGNIFKKKKGSESEKQNINDVFGLNSEIASSTNLTGILKNNEEKQKLESETKNLSDSSILKEGKIDSKQIGSKNAISVTVNLLGGKFVSSGLFWVFLIFFSTLVYFYFKHRKSVEGADNVGKK